MDIRTAAVVHEVLALAAHSTGRAAGLGVAAPDNPAVAAIAEGGTAPEEAAGTVLEEATGTGRVVVSDTGPPVAGRIGRGVAAGTAQEEVAGTAQEEAAGTAQEEAADTAQGEAAGIVRVEVAGTVPGQEVDTVQEGAAGIALEGVAGRNSRPGEAPVRREAGRLAADGSWCGATCRRVRLAGNNWYTGCSRQRGGSKPREYVRLLPATYPSSADVGVSPHAIRTWSDKGPQRRGARRSSDIPPYGSHSGQRFACGRLARPWAKGYGSLVQIRRRTAGRCRNSPALNVQQRFGVVRVHRGDACSRCSGSLGLDSASSAEAESSSANAELVFISVDILRVLCGMTVAQSGTLNHRFLLSHSHNGARTVGGRTKSATPKLMVGLLSVQSPGQQPIFLSFCVFFIVVINLGGPSKNQLTIPEMLPLANRELRSNHPGWWSKILRQ